MNKIHKTVRQALDEHLKQRSIQSAGAGVSGHFSREAKLMLGLVLVVVVLGLSMAVVWPRISMFLAVDRCLDSGGSFNYNSNQCEGAHEAPRS